MLSPAPANGDAGHRDKKGFVIIFLKSSWENKSMCCKRAMETACKYATGHRETISSSTSLTRKARQQQVQFRNPGSFSDAIED
ncbi:hypothetical protein BRADI_2g07823v3 [Brachypodium distachyon]|uniref:Uncharacterized protein n=1 Tax=Brachypodium distachyon TaxID=15368 RepID=A0A2K2D7G4_BRADI|nr:hypothetical protein BRADI_2g07823v3 [Brachypodium distachyon]